MRIPFADREMEVAVVGQPGVIDAWRAATDNELDAMTSWADAPIALRRLTDRDLALGWTGTVCDVEATLTVAPRRLVVSPAPRHGCDAMAVRRGVVLTFADLVDPAASTIELMDTVLLPEGS